MKREKSLPSIMTKMHEQRCDLELAMYKNHGKLNSSFSGYLHGEMTLLRDELQKKKIKKFKKVEDKGKTVVEIAPL
jgi:hypothetical protein